MHSINLIDYICCVTKTKTKITDMKFVITNQAGQPVLVTDSLDEAILKSTNKGFKMHEVAYSDAEFICSDGMEIVDDEYVVVTDTKGNELASVQFDISPNHDEDLSTGLMVEMYSVDNFRIGNTPLDKLNLTEEGKQEIINMAEMSVEIG